MGQSAVKIINPGTTASRLENFLFIFTPSFGFQV